MDSWMEFCRYCVKEVECFTLLDLVQCPICSRDFKSEIKIKDKRDRRKWAKRVEQKRVQDNRARQKILVKERKKRELSESAVIDAKKSKEREIYNQPIPRLR